MRTVWLSEFPGELLPCPTFCLDTLGKQLVGKLRWRASCHGGHDDGQPLIRYHRRGARIPALTELSETFEGLSHRFALSGRRLGDVGEVNDSGHWVAHAHREFFPFPKGLRLVSDLEQEVLLSVRPSRLVRFSLFEQLVDLERFDHLTPRER